jgi:predicted  nucleic acid-binding Zn-ribbon protein
MMAGHESLSGSELADAAAAVTGVVKASPRDEGDRTRQRQERNRLAAKKCREKKQREYAELDKVAQLLRQENQSLRTQLTQLHKELHDLKSKIGLA